MIVPGNPEVPVVPRLPPRSLRSPKTTRQKIDGEGHCRMCLRPTHVRPLTRHHLVPESWFRQQPLPMRAYRNAHANVVPLCRPCHDLIHDDDRDARYHLRRSLVQQEVAFVIAVRGQQWLDHFYPRDVTPRATQAEVASG